MPAAPLELSPTELKALLDVGKPLRLIDVREPEEFAICRIEGSKLLPMGSIPMRWQELDDDGPPIVAICHHGVRSLRVVEWLRARGLEECSSMAGGIDLWSLTVDPSVPRY